MKTIQTQVPRALLIAATVLAFASSGFGQLIVDFNNYTVGDLSGQAGGTGLTGNWTGVTNNDVVAGNLSGPAASSSLIYAQTGTAQKLQTNQPATDFLASQTYISLATPITTTYWTSFLLQGTGGSDRLGVSFNANGNGLDNYSFALFKAGDNIAIRGAGSAEVAVTGNDFFLVSKVTRVNSGTLTIDLFVNPTSLSSFDAPAQLTRTNVALTATLSSIGVFGYNNTASSIDNMRFGSQLSDVVVVPEPSTFAMAMLLGGLVMMTLLRRRRA